MNDKIEEFLEFQKEADNSREYSEVQRMFLDQCEARLKEIMTRDIDLVVKELVQQDYDDFLEVWKKVLEEKKEEMSIDDVKKELPENNPWLKILNGYKLKKDDVLK